MFFFKSGSLTNFTQIPEEEEEEERMFCCERITSRISNVKAASFYGKASFHLVKFPPVEAEKMNSFSMVSCY